jgi:copper chaperone NosL
VKKLVFAIVAIAAAVLLIVRCGTRVPDEVQPIAWNEEACGHCHMLIGDPAFAAQVISDDGEVVSFDDPGCAARYLRSHAGHVHRAWFHEGRGERWLSIEDVAFVRVPASPMGSNVMAVPKPTPGSIALEELR